MRQAKDCLITSFTPHGSPAEFPLFCNRCAVSAVSTTTSAHCLNCWPRLQAPWPAMCRSPALPCAPATLKQLRVKQCPPVHARRAAPDPQRIVQIMQPDSNLPHAVQGPPLHAGTLQHPETLMQCRAHLCTLAVLPRPVLPRLWAAAARSARRLACSARTSASAARARSSSARTVASRCSRAASLWSRVASRSPSACSGSRTG